MDNNYLHPQFNHFNIMIDSWQFVDDKSLNIKILQKYDIRTNDSQDYYFRLKIAIQQTIYSAIFLSKTNNQIKKIYSELEIDKLYIISNYKINKNNFLTSKECFQFDQQTTFNQTNSINQKSENQDNQILISDLFEGIKEAQLIAKASNVTEIRKTKINKDKLNNKIQAIYFEFDLQKIEAVRTQLQSKNFFIFANFVVQKNEYQSKVQFPLQIKFDEYMIMLSSENNDSENKNDLNSQFQQHPQLKQINSLQQQKKNDQPIIGKVQNLSQIRESKHGKFYIYFGLEIEGGQLTRTFYFNQNKKELEKIIIELKQSSSIKLIKYNFHQENGKDILIINSFSLNKGRDNFQNNIPINLIDFPSEQIQKEKIEMQQDIIKKPKFEYENMIQGELTGIIKSVNYNDKIIVGCCLTHEMLLTYICEDVYDCEECLNSNDKKQKNMIGLSMIIESGNKQLIGIHYPINCKLDIQLLNVYLNKKCVFYVQQINSKYLYLRIKNIVQNQ